MTSSDEVEVLLATYNGAAFLREQVRSVLAQEGVDVVLTARDDGSSDDTVELLGLLAVEYAGRLRLLTTCSPTGSARGNFAELLRWSSGEYAAFCDQDDVWLPGKLAACIGRMQAMEEQFGARVPLLVFTDLAVVDEQLRPVAGSLWAHNGVSPEDVRRLGRLLGDNVVTGCTVLMNRAMAKLAGRMVEAGEAVVMHDHWVALLACTLGRAEWVGEATVLYRQHGRNAVGAAAVDGSVLGRVRRLLGREAVERRRVVRRVLERQAEAFAGVYGEMLSAEQRKVLLAFATMEECSAMERWRRMVRYGFWRGSVGRGLVDVLDGIRR